jgi:hypothetical protein
MKATPNRQMADHPSVVDFTWHINKILLLKILVGQSSFFSLNFLGANQPSFLDPMKIQGAS